MKFSGNKNTKISILLIKAIEIFFSHMVHCAKLSVWVQIFVPGMMPSHILWTSQDLGEEQKYLSSLLGFSVQHLHPQCYISIIQKKQVVMLMEFEAVNCYNGNLFFKKIKFKIYSFSKDSLLPTFLDWFLFNLKNGTKIKYRTHAIITCSWFQTALEN